MVDYTKNRKPLVPASASKWVALGAWVASAGLVVWSIVSLIDNIGAFCALALAIYVFGMSMQAILAGAAEDGLNLKECMLMLVWPKEALKLIRAGSMSKDEITNLFKGQHVDSSNDALIGEKAARWTITGLLVASIVGIVVGVLSLLSFVVLITVTIYVIFVAAMLHANRSNGYTIVELLAALVGPVGMFAMALRGAGRIKRSTNS